MAADLAGVWRLVSCESERADGTVTYPYGEDALGYLIYAESGHMAVTIMSAHRPRFHVEDLRGGTTAEKAAAFDAHISYTGTYDVRGDAVVHHVEAGSFPNWTGADLVRRMVREGRRLTLTTPPFTVDGVLQTSRIVWEHV
jgi:hypothetical protein